MLSPGSTFAGYRIERLLGQGGMGAVYLVTNLALDRPEALKIISIADDDHQFQQRFTREARVAGALSHPGIVAVNHHGIEDGLPWFTMPVLNGHDLTEDRPTIDETLGVIARVADALDHAHRHNVIHRDVKPANIHLGRGADGRVDRVTVLDFGIAKLTTETGLTSTGAFIGTLTYSAPEVIDGRGLLPASDQYSLACTAYELLTGTPPFEARVPSVLMVAHLSRPAPPIGTRRPALRALDPVFARALSKDPGLRFPDCRSFARALVDPALAGAAPGRPTQSTVRPPTPGSRPPGTATIAGTSPTGYPPEAVRATTTRAAFSSVDPVGRHKQGVRRRLIVVGAVVFALLIVVVGTAVVLNRSTGTDQPGDGTERAAAQVVPIRLGTVATAQQHTCSVRDGSAFCWGGNDKGEVGDGTTIARTKPVRVAGLTDVTAVGVGWSFSCALAGGKVFCWGGGEDGAMGDGGGPDRRTPVQVPLLGEATGLTVGKWHACALVDGQAYCWGENKNGQLGDGSTADVAPVSEVRGLESVDAISAGWGSTCAVAGGSLFCWGDNEYGQLGVGHSGDSPSPARVSGLSGITQVSVGTWHACATDGDRLWCWGDGDNGQLGDGGTAAGTNSPRSVLNLTDVAAVSAGYANTCAVSGGQVSCWGSNDKGQIGDGTFTDRLVPTAVPGLTALSDVSVGNETVCVGVADGVSCWGDNDYGELGDGTRGASRSAPTQVVFP
ncbi:protein kinase domain-containing protein [Gordonia sp. NPDC003950]|jgi:serine/threonine-protein kinase